jgi:AraC family transcriptional regulator
LRTSVCITVPEDTGVGGEIGKMTIPAGKYALARFELTSSDYQEAWDWVYGTWLPQSGFVPDDRLCFELYPPESITHPESKISVDICVPVKPL